MQAHVRSLDLYNVESHRAIVSKSESVVMPMQLLHEGSCAAYEQYVPFFVWSSIAKLPLSDDAVCV